MKNLLITTVLIAVLNALLPNGSFAQDITGIGAKIGVNLATLRTEGDEDLELNSKSGFVVGGFLTYKLSEMLALQPELLYSQKGMASESIEQGTKIKVSFKLNYLEIPLLAKFTLPTQGSTKPNLYLGPAIALNLTSKIKGEALDITVEEDLEDIKSTDFGFVVGGGVDLELGQGKLSLDARYTLGLSNIDDGGVDEPTKNGVFSLLAGYSLNANVLNFGNNPGSPTDGKKGSIGTVGAGFGIPYGGMGINGEYAVTNNLNLTAGIGTTVVAGMGFDIGIKYYLNEAGHTWRPRVAAYYGTNGAIQVIGRGASEDAFSGLSVGLGQKWMFGTSKRHGLDLDLMFIVTSGVFDRKDELESRGVQVDGTGRVKLSIGYRFGF